MCKLMHFNLLFDIQAVLKILFILLGVLYVYNVTHFRFTWGKQRNGCIATRELNPCSNFTKAMQGLTNHMASFHLILTAHVQIGLSPLPVQPRWAMQSNLAGLEVVMWWNDLCSCSYIEQTEFASSIKRIKSMPFFFGSDAFFHRRTNKTATLNVFIL